MIKRLISSIIALPIFFFILLKGGLVLQIASFVVIGITLYEYYSSTGILNFYTFIGGLLTTAYLYFIGFVYFEIYLIILLFVFLLAGLNSKKLNIEKIGIFQISIFYIIVPIYLLNLIASSKFPMMIWMIFVIAWGSDTFAYFIGRIFGKHKLAPTISPKKTIEGSIGGVCGSVLISVIFYYYFNLQALSSVYVFIIFVFITTILSQLGDLIASKIKRTFKIKDFGFIMPGHGGMLDRFDSVLIIIPIIYLFINS